MMSLKIPKSVGVVTSVTSPKCAKHISWIKTVFQAEQLGIHLSGDGNRVMHSILAINDGLLYISDFMEEFGQNQDDIVKHPPSGSLLHIDSPDAKEMFDRAIENGASVVVAMEKQPCGNMYGCVKDPFGFVWGLLQAEAEKKVAGVTPSIRHSKEKYTEHIQWLVSVFGAEVIKMYTNDEDGSTCLSILGINGGQVQIASKTLPALDFLSIQPATNHISCHLEMDDPYPLWKKALENGSTVKVELKRQFWGGIYGSLVDKMGTEWSFSDKAALDTAECPVMGIYSYIVSTQCEKQIEWIQRVFEGGIKAMFRQHESKKVLHCELAFSGGRVMICDATCGPDQKNGSPDQSVSSVPEGNVNAAAVTTPVVVIQCHCSDPDPIWSRALAEGAIVVEELKRQYWGGYFGCFKDPYGVKWSLLKADEHCGTQ